MARWEAIPEEVKKEFAWRTIPKGVVVHSNVQGGYIVHKKLPYEGRVYRVLAGHERTVFADERCAYLAYLIARSCLESPDKKEVGTCTIFSNQVKSLLTSPHLIFTLLHSVERGAKRGEGSS